MLAQSVNLKQHSEQFQSRLAFGQMAESRIVKWLRRRGKLVLPIYDIEYDSGKGPRLFGKEEMFIAPDLVVITGEEAKFIEAKHKTVFSWHRITERWVTGIDLRHYFDYLRLMERVKWPIWLLFLHESATPRNEDLRFKSPPTCPTGLFGNDLAVLAATENHRSDKHGKSGMVYWAHGSLKNIAQANQL